MSARIVAGSLLAALLAAAPAAAQNVAADVLVHSGPVVGQVTVGDAYASLPSSSGRHRASASDCAARRGGRAVRSACGGGRAAARPPLESGLVPPGLPAGDALLPGRPVLRPLERAVARTPTRWWCTSAAAGTTPRTASTAVAITRVTVTSGTTDLPERRPGAAIARSRSVLYGTSRHPAGMFLFRARCRGSRQRFEAEAHPTHRMNTRCAMARLLAPLVGLALLHPPGYGRGPVLRPQQGPVRDFDFKVLQTDHFDVYFYPDEREAADIAGRMAERWYTRLSTRAASRAARPAAADSLCHRSRSSSRPTSSTGPRRGHRRRHRGASPPHRAADRRDARRPRPRHRPRADPRLPVRHDRRGRARRRAARFPRRAALPLWFIEGMAEYLSLGPVAPADRDVDARRGPGHRRDSLPTSGSSRIRGSSPTATARRCWPTWRDRWGDPIMGELLRAPVRTRGVDQAIRGVLALTPDQLVHDWHAATARRRTSILEARPSRPDSYGARLVKACNGTMATGSYNIGARR